MIKIDKGSNVPLFRQIKAGLLARINAGDFHGDAPLPTERELSEELGLSRLTVRRSILELTSEGLLRRIPGRGTYVIPHAVRAPDSALSLILPDDRHFDPGSPFISRLIQGLHQASRPGSLSLNDPLVENPPIVTHGIIALWVLDAQRMQQILAFGNPVVAYECVRTDSSVAHDTVDHANETGACSAVGSLINLGHSDIACAFHGSPTALARKLGYERAMASHGLPVNPDRLLPCMPSGEAGYALGRRLFENPAAAPTAVFCSDDNIANGILACARDAGLKVPEFISLVGFGDLGLYCTPALSSVRIDIETSAREAIRMLRERIAKPTLPTRHSSLPTDHIRRASCGAPRAR
jgi:DNA-binding transcriptional regulator YhcF (GntR family)